jgi:hypothetical protein
MVKVLVLQEVIILTMLFHNDNANVTVLQVAPINNYNLRQLGISLTIRLLPSLACQTRPSVAIHVHPERSERFVPATADTR